MGEVKKVRWGRERGGEEMKWAGDEDKGREREGKFTIKFTF